MDEKLMSTYAQALLNKPSNGSNQSSSASPLEFIGILILSGILLAALGACASGNRKDDRSSKTIRHENWRI
jgi:hypothetical protein